jgi:cytochrome c oxidase subunit II
VIAFASALTLVGSALGGNGGLLPVAPHSPNAHHIREAYIFVLVFAAIVFVAVEGILIVFVVRYRRGKRSRTAEGPQIHGSTKLEILWTVLPVVILAAIGAFIFIQLPSIANAPAASAADSTTIRVEGHQFYWLFRYPNGAISVGTMVAPADDVVNETVSAPDEDVLHSWWVPALGGKIDAIPGSVNHTWFQAPAGVYAARCGDLCGIQHTQMTAHVVVVPRGEYERFITDRANDASGAALGKEEFQHVCETCHRLDSRYIGPALGDNPLLTDAQGLQKILRTGVGRMPAVGNNWTDEQIEALVAYTRTLKKEKQ